MIEVIVYQGCVFQVVRIVNSEASQSTNAHCVFLRAKAFLEDLDHFIVEHGMDMKPPLNDLGVFWKHGSISAPSANRVITPGTIPYDHDPDHVYVYLEKIL